MASELSSNGSKLEAYGLKAHLTASVQAAGSLISLGAVPVKQLCFYTDFLNTYAHSTGTEEAMRGKEELLEEQMKRINLFEQKVQSDCRIRRLCLYCLMQNGWSVVTTCFLLTTYEVYQLFM